MAITLIINGISRTVDSGASIAVAPSDRIQIQVNGLVIDPAAIERSVTPPDVVLTLPDGQIVTLEGFVDLSGQAGGGLEGADGTIVIASTIEALSAPAAGGDDGPDTAGGNNLSAFNQVNLGDLGGNFGTSGGSPGGATGGIGTGDDGTPGGPEQDPNELLTVIPGTPVVGTAATDPATATTTTMTADASPNLAPVTVADSGAITEDAASNPIAGNVLTNDSDPDGPSALTVSQVNGLPGNVGVPLAGTFGSLTLGADGAYVYTLNNALPAVQALAAGQQEQEVFTYQAFDGLVATTSTLTVTITGANDAPAALDDPAAGLALLSKEIVIPAADLLANDSDPEGDPFTLTRILGATNGTATLDTAAQTVTFIATPGFVGEASFIYEIADDGSPALTASATATVEVVGALELSDVEAGSDGFVINGVSTGDFSGRSVSGAGDVNGDGLDDLIVGAPYDDPNGDASGATFVVFGKADGTAVALSDVEAGSGGFVINGVSAGDWSGQSVSGAGDVNGDGLDDLIVGARNDDPNGDASGASFMVFGKADGTAVALFDVEAGIGGFVINGVSAFDRSGISVSGAGDVNGDGLDDLIVGAYGDDPNGDQSGASFVVFGKADGTAVALSDVEAGTGGFVINGVSAGDQSGFSVSGAGDVNGDGLDDLIVGARSDDPNGGSSGASFVVFGKAEGTAVELSAVEAGTGGFVINGVSAFDRSGFSVSGAGDVNGDGLDDLIVGAYGDDPNGGYSGASFVVFGKADGTAVALSDVEAGTVGFVINGVSAGERSGFSVSGAGDVNGDGLDDLIVGAPFDDPNGDFSGASFVVFGKADGTAVALSDVEAGAGGFVINGVSAGDFSGVSVSGAGDVNGDGFADLIVGARTDDPNGGSSGASFVVFGGNFTGSVDLLGTDGGQLLSGSAADEVINGGAGDDTLVGGGGADVLFGGEGDDLLAVADTSFERLQGGNGIDTLRLDGSDLSLDLTGLADNRTGSLEVIDLAGGGNSLTLGKLDVLQLLGSEGLTTLRVLGEAGDAVDLTGFWSALGEVTEGATTFNSFLHQDGTTRVLVEAGVAVSSAAAVALSDVEAGSGGFVINGVSAGDFSGYSVSGAGDVNGDGLDDLIVGASGDDPNGSYSGASFVVFGKADGTAVALSDVEAGSGGFVINGVSAYDWSGISVSGAGDVNGDGLDDLIVGAQYDDPNGGLSGASFVVFGKADGTAVALSDVEAGSGGFVINGVSAGDLSGYSVSGAGDVNGDGLDDLIVGAWGDDPNGNSSGASFVVFGKADGTVVALSDVEAGTGGFVINGVSAGDYAGFSVSGAGDVNGDGLDDLIVGAHRDDPNGGYSGASFVVFGKAEGTAVALSDVEAGTGGFVINGVSAGDYAGFSVSGAGDVNGDGLDDLIVGAHRDDPNGGYSGASFVVFGKAEGTAVALSDVETGSGGFVINGVSAGDYAGFSASGAGDVNGDGLDDLIVGAWRDDPNGSSSGASFVVFGKTDGTAVALSDVETGSGGFVINGVSAGDRSGYSVSGAGDVDGDGFADLIVGAWRDDPNGDQSGASFVVFGGNFTGSVDLLGTDGGQLLSGSAADEVINGGAGDDTLVGGGGADVLFGGEGDDLLAVADTSFERLQGGNGIDTLRLDGSDLSLDLTGLADNRTGSLEVIDLAGGGNSLTLGKLDVLQLLGSEGLTTLRVLGETGDAVALTGFWSALGEVTEGATTFNSFLHQDGTTRVLVEAGVAVSSAAAVALSDVEAGSGGFVINGVSADDFSGFSVSGAGDVNGDGLDDLIVGARNDDPNGESSGASFVVFGKANGTAVELSDVEAGTGGFVINGVSAGDFSGYSVSGAGDVNGDGLDDLIVGAYGDDPNGGRSGTSFVVFGKADGTAVALSDVEAGTGGFVVNGVSAYDFSGRSVSGAGDVNGDGLDDLIVGARNDDPNGDASGASFVVFGKAGGTAVELSDVEAGTGGFVINGVSADDRSGISVSGAGDVNGDGLDDLIVGAPFDDPNGGSSGASFVVFGKAEGTAVELSDVEAGSGGFVINGVSADDRSGISVSGAGDVNGDGLDDLIVGANSAYPKGASLGESYVVFGKAEGTAVELSDVEAGTGGFVIKGVSAGDGFGLSVSGAGDVNGDGLDDLIVGASLDDPNGDFSGASFVVFGKADGTAVALSDVEAGAGGFVINGVSAGDRSGFSVSGAGDVNGDGFADLIVGAYGDDPNGGSSGASFVVFGGNFTGSVDLLGTDGGQLLSGSDADEVINGGAGDDTLVGGGGADVLFGGEGDDLLAVADTSFERLQGGNGIDTLRLDGSDLSLDLTGLADNRTGSLEVIDLAGGGNSLMLGKLDVLQLLGSEGLTTLRVLGEAGDAVALTGFWSALGEVTEGTTTFNSFLHQDGTTRVLVEAGVAVSSAAAVALSDVEAGTGGFVINGVSAGDRSGFSVSGTGDVNGDGLDDLIVGAPFDDPNGNDSGASFVVFGKAEGTAVELSEVEAGTGGFVINGVSADDRSGFSVSGAGDVNGDGLDDLIVGARNDDPNGDQSGASFVVFGKADGTAVELSDVEAGSGGFVINGVSAGDLSGYSVSGAGDVNGDGLDDLIVGAHRDDPNGESSGASFVVFGKADGTAVALSDVEAGTGGFVINGVSARDYTGFSVSGAGDVNGDGLDDLIVGARNDDPNGDYSGATFVVFGKAEGTAVALSDVEAGTGGFVINGVSADDRSGHSVSGAGDVNGDGLDDLIVGAFGDDPNGGSSGASFVVFGKADGTAVALSDVEAGTGGFVINGVSAYDFSGISVSGAGDVNGDGLDDLIVGATFDDPNGGSSGASFVVFGKADGSAVELSDVETGSGGFVINGVSADDYAGRSVSGAGDVNGDGFADLIVGARGDDPNGGSSGASFVVFGGNFTGSVDLLGTDGGQLLSGSDADEVINGGAGDDTLVGGGGADVLFGGEGDDLLAVADTSFERLQGGNGIDTLRLDGSDLSLDLTGLADNRTGSLEVIDLAGGGNSLTLGKLDVLQLLGSEGLTTLRVLGETGDAVALTGFWSALGEVTEGTTTFNSFLHQDGTTRVLVEAGVAVSAAAAVALSDVEAGSGGFVINGVSAGDFSGFSVSGAGDVNGDGLDDLIVGAYGDDPNGESSGASFVVFGKADGAAVALSDVEAGTGGFVINGVSAGDRSGFSVSGAGDVNGDGFADLIVGARGDDPNGESSGASFVVFGKADGTAVALSDVEAGTGGFVINGVSAGDLSGYSVSGAGDVNGDGLDDLIVGAFGDDPNGRSSGASFVVFGKADGTAVALSDVEAGTGGFVINGVSELDLSGYSMSGAGDVNGDGLDDLIVGARGDDPNGRSSGASFVVFGKTDGTAVELSDVEAGTGGFVINGISELDRSGISVSGAGDVNGDGLDDLIVGAFGDDPNGGYSGASFVVFGKADGTAVALSDVEAGSGGFVINGVSAGDRSGFSVSGAGDVNGDGLDDLIVGAYGDDPNGDYSGASFVVFGKAEGTAVALSDVEAGSGGFVINGVSAGDYAGRSVSGAGDVNGDGFADLIVGARGDDPNGGSSGASFVVFGGNFTGSVDLLGTDGGQLLSGSDADEVINGGAGDDTLVGGGGADVLFGGEGDDLLAVADTSFERLQGGNGIDTLRLDGGGLSLDLTGLADNRIEDIEAIDLGAGGTADAATLTLDLRELLNISSESNRLLVTGDDSDTVDTGGLTDSGGDEVIDGITYDVFTDATSGQDAELLIQQGIQIA